MRRMKSMPTMGDGSHTRETPAATEDSAPGSPPSTAAAAAAATLAGASTPASSRRKRGGVSFRVRNAPDADADAGGQGATPQRSLAGTPATAAAATPSSTSSK